MVCVKSQGKPNLCVVIIEMTRNDSVERFMCGLIGGVEDLVHFM